MPFKIEMTPRGVLLAGQWRTVDELNNMPPAEQRKSMVLELNKQPNQTTYYFSGFYDDTLVGKLATVVFLRHFGIRNDDELKTMPDYEQRNAMVVENNKHTGRSIPELSALSDKELVQVGLEWFKIPVYRKMKVTNLATGQFLGYLGRNPKLFAALEYTVGEITWTFKESDVEKIGFGPGAKIPTSAEDWAREGWGYLALKNTIHNIVPYHRGQLWLLGDEGLDSWATWSWTSNYTRLQWNENHTVTAMPEGDLMLYVGDCPETPGSYLRWGKATNPSVVRLDFE